MVPIVTEPAEVTASWSSEVLELDITEIVVDIAGPSKPLWAVWGQ